MNCNQCEETVGGKNCTKIGVCGKTETTANLQDMLLFVCRGIAVCNVKAKELGLDTTKPDMFIMDSLFATITNANFDEKYFMFQIKRGIRIRDQIKLETCLIDSEIDSLAWTSESNDEISTKAVTVGLSSIENEDIKSLKEITLYGLKGIAAYLKHAITLGETNKEIFDFINKALSAINDDNTSAEDLTNMVFETGKNGVDVMALLDKANTAKYGNPEPTEVNIGVGTNPGILVSGHDLKDIDMLLKQTEGTGVDVYTHGEMLPTHSYPEFKKHKHLIGNYGGSWWKQGEEFEKFNGPILMTTNCIIPPRESYKDRIYTTSVVGFDGVKHIDELEDGHKDFSAIIEQAKGTIAPTEIETGIVMGGFAHGSVLSLADKVVEAVKSGAVKKFVVMAGCDGRHRSRQYYEDFAKGLSDDSIILTAGCAKYRYNKLGLGDIGGIPRVLDAGQCNDSYSLVVIAKKLAEAFELDDINKLPIKYNIAWYEQKAVIVLLALLHLGVKDIHLGPTLPAFVSPNVLNILIEKFNISGIGTVEEDLVKLA